MDEAMKEARNDMDCARFEDLVHELDRPETEGAALREEALVHAESCGRCAALLTEVESLGFALVKIADEAGRTTAPARVEAALLQEFRRAKATSSGRRLQWRVAAIGIAAALFLALGLSLRHRFVPVSGADAGTHANVSAPAKVPNDATAAGNGNSQRDVPGASSTAQATELTADDADGTEFAEDFTPLPYADDASMMEGGAVVRVTLSRSALASFGVPLTDIGSAEQIPADLMVSADGTPEAIRLVSQNVN